MVAGADISFLATPDAGAVVSTWTLDGTVVQNGGTTYTLSNISANHTVQVNFVSSVTYTVTPIAGANGTISPNTPQTVQSGGSLTFKGTPSNGYTIYNWEVNGTQVQLGGVQYTLSNINANCTVLVTFTAGAGDWWMFHHDPQHTGRSAFLGPIAPTQKWLFTSGSTVYSSPHHSGAMVPFMSARNPIRCMRSIPMARKSGDFRPGASSGLPRPSAKTVLSTSVPMIIMYMPSIRTAHNNGPILPAGK